MCVVKDHADLDAGPYPVHDSRYGQSQELSGTVSLGFEEPCSMRWTPKEKNKMLSANRSAKNVCLICLASVFLQKKNDRDYHGR
jgi:hypothetical protein